MKKTLRIVGGFIYFVLLLAFGVILIKPGAEVFYSKFKLESKVTDDSRIYEASLSTPLTDYDLDSLLLRENGNILTKVQLNDFSLNNRGVYIIIEETEDKVVFRILPSENVNPASSDIEYQALIHPNIITGPWCKVIMAILILGLVLFLISIGLNKARRQIFCRKPFIMDPIDFKAWWKSKNRILGYSFISGMLSLMLYVFMEWIFFVTKASFMDILSIWEKGNIFIITGFVLSFLPIILTCLIFVLDLIFTCLHSSYNEFVYFLPAGFVLACLGLILVDNFIYTVFQFGIVKATTPFRVFYALLFLTGFVLIVRDRVTNYMKIQERGPRKTAWALGITTIILVGVIVLGVNYKPAQISDIGDINSAGMNTPNIIFLSNDGLNASNLSVYGYERETTPFLEELAETSLVMLNNFTNATTSTGSDTALLTGKSPLETGVLYPPNTLKGQDMFEHLPGILKKNGYKTISMGIPHFVDVNTINFRNAFDEVNGEKNSSSVFIETASSVGYNDAAYFITTITNRILERLGHIFFIKDMDDPFAIVSGENYMSDSSILEELRTTLIETQQSNQPLFAHIHLVSTHGPTFDPKVEKFSAGETQDEEWMIDFYDDAILTFDQNLQAFVEFLENKELFDNTILVIYSDHGYQWSATDKIPLIIHFPQDLNAGTVSENTQNLDISSTILDYMGIEQPTWMGGSTLLGELRQDRILFSAGMKSSIASNGQIVEQIITPPFYQFGRLYVIKCQMLYEIDLQNLAMGTLHIDHYIDPCSENMLASEMEIWSEAGQMLSDLGYELPAEWPK